MKKWQLILLFVVVAVFAAGIGAYAATNYGTQTDPLITLSYLNDSLKPSMVTEFDSQLEKAMEKLENQFQADIANASGAFRAVSLASGQTLTGGEGTEILLVSGKASAAGTLVDATSGGTAASGGALTANHLYMCSGASGGLTASGAVELMVRGGYSVG